MQFAIVDDEDIFASQVIQYLDKYSQESGIEIKTTRYPDGKKFIEGYVGQFDAVFMDIIMPVMGGLEAATLLRKKDEDIPIVFMTNIARYALDGYKVNALDFVVKPVTYQDIKLKVDKIDKYKKKFGVSQVMISSKDEVRMVNTRDILYIEVLNHNLIYHTVFGDYTQRGTLTQVMNSGKFTTFVRSNSCYFVNCSHVTGVQGDNLYLHDKALPISRRRFKDFMEFLTDFMGGEI